MAEAQKRRGRPVGRRDSYPRKRRSREEMLEDGHSRSSRKRERSPSATQDNPSWRRKRTGTGQSCSRPEAGRSSSGAERAQMHATMQDEDLMLHILQAYGDEIKTSQDPVSFHNSPFGHVLKEVWQRCQHKVQPSDVMPRLRGCSYIGCWFRVDTDNGDEDAPVPGWSWYISRRTHVQGDDVFRLSGFVDGDNPRNCVVESDQVEFERAAPDDQEYYCYDLFEDASVHKLRKFTREIRKFLSER
eukprot:89296-Hanusia_phi.AAC.1